MSKSVTSVKEVHLLYFTVGFHLISKYFNKICMKGSKGQVTKSKSRVAKIMKNFRIFVNVSVILHL